MRFLFVLLLLVPFTSGQVLLTDYGAVCDGSFDDSDAIEDAFSCSNCKIVIPNGTCMLGRWVYVNSNTSVIGLGGSIVKSISGTTGSFVGNYTASNIVFKDFTFDGDNESLVPFSFMQRGPHDVVILDNVAVKNVVNRAFLFEGGFVSVRNSLFENVQNGVSITSHGDVHITDNKFIGNPDFTDITSSEYGEGIDVNTHGTGQVIITNNFISGFKEEAIDANVKHALISNNILHLYENSRPSHGIYFGTHDPMLNAKASIVNNIVLDIGSHGQGIKLFCNNGSIVSNNILIGLEGSDSRGVQMHSCAHNNIISSNLFENLETGIFLNTEDVVVSSNEFRNVSRNIDGANDPSFYLGSDALYSSLFTTLGLGTNDPQYPVDIHTDISNIMRLKTSTLGSYINFENSAYDGSVSKIGFLGDEFRLYTNDNLMFRVHDGMLDFRSKVIRDLFLNWSYLQNFPSGCPQGQFVQSVGDKITCGVPSLDGISTLGNEIHLHGNVELSNRDDGHSRVGIGLENPESKLHVFSSQTNVGLTVESSDSSSCISLKDDATFDEETVRLCGVGNNMYFWINGFNTLRIFDDKLGIGISPSVKLDVADDSVRIREDNACSGSCFEGEIAWNEEFICVCVKDDVWKKAMLS